MNLSVGPSEVIRIMAEPFSHTLLLPASLAATDETRLRDEFSQFGTVADVFLPVERSTSRPRG